MEVDHKKLRTIIRRCYEVKQPLFIHGAPGIGKSQAVRDVAKNIAKEANLEFSDANTEDGKFGFVDSRISQMDPSDLRGLPKLDGNVTKWLPPNWLPQKEDSKGLLFFDELNLAPPSIQAACYQLILDRKLGDYRLPDGWMIIAAGNRAEDRANVFDMPAPLKNRFVHAELTVPSVEQWTDWAMDNHVNEKVLAFLQFKPSYLFKFDPEGKDNAYPTPRMWYVCSNLIEQVKDLDTQELLIGSAVGTATATELSAFLKLSRKINIDDIIKNPKKAEKIKEIDLKYSLIGGVVEKFKHKNDLLGRITEICEYLEGAEFSIFLLRLLKSANGNYFAKNMPKTKSWSKLANKYAKYLL